MDLRKRGINWAFFAWVVLIYGGLAVTGVLGIEVRLTSCVLSFLACSGLTYRLGTTWRETNVLLHACVAVLIVLLALGGFGQAQLLTADIAVPKTWVVWPIAVVRATCLLLIIKWPKWMDRHYSPLLRTPPANAR